MGKDPWSLLPAYRRIENALKLYIEKEGLKRHDKLPAEAQFAAQFKVSLGTVRKAMNNLAAENVVYRRHGHGTFVAPRVRKGKILVASHEVLFSRHPRSQCFDFFIGAMIEAQESDLPYEPILVDDGDFRRNLEDIKLLYPDASGVIFFRGGERVNNVRKQLDEQHFPYMYYGTNAPGDLPDGCPAIYYDEYEIARELAAHLYARGYRRIAGVAGAFPISLERSPIFAAVCAEFGMAYTALPLPVVYPSSLEIFSDDALKRVVEEFDAINGFVDIVAIRLIQRLERDLGFRIPDDLAVVGVDNLLPAVCLRPGLTTVDLCNQANGANAFRRFSALLSGETPLPFREAAQLKLIIREST